MPLNPYSGSKIRKTAPLSPEMNVKPQNFHVWLFDFCLFEYICRPKWERLPDSVMATHRFLVPLF